MGFSSKTDRANAESSGAQSSAPERLLKVVSQRVPPKNGKRLRVGELAKRTGKTVRAIRLYEELGLLRPAARTQGGFREYDSDAELRIEWIGKLQAIGFSLAEIGHFVSEFENADTGRSATNEVRARFAVKLADVREKITKLQAVETDLRDALAYLESCRQCPTDFTPIECGGCDHHGHDPREAPPLFTALAGTQQKFDTSVTKSKSLARQDEPAQ